MEQSLASLAFRGSVVEAIAEAKQQKKLFVVYIAGDSPESKLLETSTWVDPKVSETVAKYCILLHLLEGSSEASNFSALYPQQSTPCITAIGYNGVQLWQKEGLVPADVLASSLEKAWLSLHFQLFIDLVGERKCSLTCNLYAVVVLAYIKREETTAAFLTAALASGGKFATGTAEAASSGEADPGTNEPSPSIDNHILSRSAVQPSHAETPSHRKNHKDGPKEDENATFPEPSHANVEDNITLESVSETETGPDHVVTDQNSGAKKDLDLCDSHLRNSDDASREIVDNDSKVPHYDIEETTKVEKAGAPDSSSIEPKGTSGSSATRSNDVFLNIRLPDGSSLQVMFSVMDTLKMVKDYIIKNQTSSLGSFNVAIPYPRKVFNDQDLENTLSELGLFNRQALVVVPSNQNNSHDRGGSLQHRTYSSNDDGSSNESDGYWASVKRIVAYVNPFSYLSRSTNSTSDAPESQSGIWEYSPNPSPQNSVRDGAGRPFPFNPYDRQSTPGSSSRNDNSKSRQETSRFGANIHTLKRDEDDDSRFNDRNAFWNGNSTQYGGNDDGK